MRSKLKRIVQWALVTIVAAFIAAIITKGVDKAYDHYYPAKPATTVQKPRTTTKKTVKTRTVTETMEEVASIE